MEQGKIYYVWDAGEGFWMIGKCLKAPSADPIRCDSTIITSKDEYCSNNGWCFGGGRRKYREATPEEQQWFEECDRQGKFIPKDKIKFTYEIY